jgi:antitoxin component of RelBE/YafQ-DinJ toxin-antitoxin module
MRDEYDFSQSIPSPYLKKLKNRVSVRLEPEVLDYFKKLSEETGISSDNLINLYLRDCIKSGRKPSLE